MAGTANSAELLGIADQTGTLQSGKFADIVAVAGNPVMDIKATQHPIFVMEEGVIYLGGHIGGNRSMPMSGRTPVP